MSRTLDKMRHISDHVFPNFHRAPNMSTINGSSEEQPADDFDPLYTYEVESCRSVFGSEPNEARTGVERCRPEEAEFWGVYRRPVRVPGETGPTLAEWVSDHPDEQAARRAATELYNDRTNQVNPDQVIEQMLNGSSDLMAAEGVFAPLWRELLQQRSVTVMDWNVCMNRYLCGLSDDRDERIALRNNLTRELTGRRISEQAFLKGLEMLGIAKFRVMIEAKNATGEHQLYVSPVYVVRK